MSAPENDSLQRSTGTDERVTPGGAGAPGAGAVPAPSDPEAGMPNDLAGTIEAVRRIFAGMPSRRRKSPPAKPAPAGAAEEPPRRGFVIVRMALSRVIADPEVQVREGLDEDALARYQEALANGAKFPPIPRIAPAAPGGGLGGDREGGRSSRKGR